MKKYLWSLAILAVFTLVISGCGKKKDAATPADEAAESAAAVDESGSGIDAAPGQVPSLDLARVHFEFDQSTLTAEAKRILRNNADVLSANGSVSIVVEGHCDDRGSVEYNLALGERRAQSIKNYLSQLGVSSDRLSTISYGEERPMVMEQSESAWAKNRRGEFVASP